MEPKLTAILAADVVGYSRLMEADEKATLASLKAHHAELIDPEIAGHNGRIVKLMGDGILAEFASVVDAVNCAVGLQRGMAARNARVPQGRHPGPAERAAHRRRDRQPHLGRALRPPVGRYLRPSGRIDADHRGRDRAGAEP